MPSRVRCKYPEILRNDPHKLIEGALNRRFAMRARAAYIYIRGEYIMEAKVMRRPVKEAYDAGLIGKNAASPANEFRRLRPSRGGWRYICGEKPPMIGKPRSKEGSRA